MNQPQSEQQEISKQPYSAPTLIVHGSVEEITQNVFHFGRGDTWAGGVLGGLLASK